ncbi:MAG: MFS transporter [Ruminococcaceae bacterium]|nr:MFS transporter [Oscillospiraceae bacterium]
MEGETQEIISQSEKEEKRLKTRKYLTVVLCFLMVMTVLGFCSSAKSLYIAPITEALNISRSAFSINDSMRFISTAVINMFFGTLIARYGAKKLIGAGFLSLIASCLIYSFAENVFVFYIGGVFLGIGISWTTTTMVGAIINDWCKENKGTIMGAVLAANGVGAAIAIKILSGFIYGSTFGYRTAYMISAGVMFVVFIIFMFFFKNAPREVANSSAPAKTNGKKKSKGSSWAGIEYSDAIKKKYFYASVFCIFVSGMILQGTTGIASPHLKDIGFDPDFVATALSVQSLALTVSKFSIGVIYDKTGLRTTANICYFTSIGVMLILASLTNSPTGQILAICYSVFVALALPLETVMLPIFAGDLFGQKSYNKILGIFASVNTAGYAVGAPISNLCYDLTGSYNFSIYMNCAIMLVATIIMQFVVKAANKEKKAQDEKLQEI